MARGGGGGHHGQGDDEDEDEEDCYRRLGFHVKIPHSRTIGWYMYCFNIRRSQVWLFPRIIQQYYVFKIILPIGGDDRFSNDCSEYFLEFTRFPSLCLTHLSLVNVE